MPDKLQVISMRTDPNRRSARVDKLAELYDKWTMRAVIWVHILATGMLIGMKLAGG